MKIVAIVGGTSNPSNSDVLCDAFLEGVRQQAGTETEKFVLRTLRIDEFTLACYDASFVPEPDFALLQKKLEDADGFVIATPVWNFGVPANLKNFIDRCGSFGLDAETRTIGQWNGKPCFLIFTGGGPATAWTGLFHRTTSALHTSLQYFGASHAGTHYEPRCTVAKGVFGLVVDQRPASLATARSKGLAFARLTKHYVETGSLPVTQSIRRWVYRVGQKIQKRFL